MITLLKILVRFFAWFFRHRKPKWQPGMPIRCLVVGYGGANNTGAEARTIEAIRQMLDADLRIHITLTSLDRSRTLRYLEENERLKVAEINPVFIFSLAKLVAAADIVVLVEGSCFKENFSPALLWFFLYAAELAQKLGIPTVTYGVDAGALTPKNAKWARDVAQKIDLLMVRTSHAEHVLRLLGVKRKILVTTDTAFSLVPEDSEWMETVLTAHGIDLKKPVVGIAFEEFFWWPVVPSIWRAVRCVKKDRYKSIYYHSWQGEARKKSIAMKEAIAAYADWVASEFNVQVIFFAMESLDISPCRDVISIMKSTAPLFDADHITPSQMAALLQRLDWLVTCRYHALILAMPAGVPVIGLAHDERIASVMDELELLHDFLISHEEKQILPELREKTLKLRSSSDRIRKRIESSMPAYLSRMEQNKINFTKLVAEKFGNY